MERNKGAIQSRINKLKISNKETKPLGIWFDEYEQKLFKLQSEKNKIEEKINAIRAQILGEMEKRSLDIIDSTKYSIRYYPARTVIQFDSKAFKEEHEELYSSYCSPKEMEASIVVKRNKEEES